MNIVLLQTQPEPHELDLLLREFPQYLFLSLSPSAYKSLNQEHWSHVEILFGHSISNEELTKAHQLHWIHTPSDQFNDLCIEAISERGTVLITTSNEENTQQIGEFVLSVILAFAKHLFDWKINDDPTPAETSSQLIDTMWSLDGRTLLQIGLSGRGTEIARVCSEMNMHVLGAAKRRSFHPYCQETLAYRDIHSFLPDADVVSLSLPFTPDWTGWLGSKEFALMKDDSLLIVTGSYKLLNETALISAVNSGKLRGVFIDTIYDTPPPSSSPLRHHPKIITTPGISPYPKNSRNQAFRSFLFNLRQYAHGNFSEMRNLASLPEQTNPPSI